MGLPEQKQKQQQQYLTDKNGIRVWPSASTWMCVKAQFISYK